MTSNEDVKTVAHLSVRRRAAKAAAIEFTGKNGREVVAFVNDHTKVDHIRNGGSYITIQVLGTLARVRKGDYVIVDSDGSLLIRDTENFNLLFAVKK